MDIVTCLALVDELWSGQLDGSGYRIVELGGSGGEECEGEPTADDVYALEGALTDLLTARRGAPARWGTGTLQERVGRGEEIPEPWARLAGEVVEVRGWENTDTGRWVVVAVADTDPEAAVRLLLVGSDVAPA
ncbi:hypothetical protein ACYF6T_26455 [Streptomyces sp. 7R007]